MRASAGAAYDLGYRVVWCPTYRCPAFGGRVKDRFKELIRAEAGEHGWEVVALGVMPGQLRLFVKPCPTNSPSSMAGRLKGFTSHHLRAEFGHLRSRLPALWPRPCRVATAGAVPAETVRRSIETQDERPSTGGGGA
ncbi:IS200/IS605 family transposase [Nonomuraea sp. NPDC049421]|uniref:IS200/IS605 family transposase n=1 Tax=Nonomuraea sp. NPDC049421 TaxID=3155275 RepID=UPI003413016F